MASRSIFRDRDLPLVDQKGYKAPTIVNNLGKSVSVDQEKFSFPIVVFILSHPDFFDDTLISLYHSYQRSKCKYA